MYWFNTWWTPTDKNFNTFYLPEEVFAVFIDAYYTKIRDDNEKMTNRGLKKMVFVSDDFSRLTDVVNQFFPYSDYQLYWTHMKRNLRRKFNKRKYSLA